MTTSAYRCADSRIKDSILSDSRSSVGFGGGAPAKITSIGDPSASDSATFPFRPVPTGMRQPMSAGSTDGSLRSEVSPRSAGTPSTWASVGARKSASSSRQLDPVSAAAIAR